MKPALLTSVDDGFDDTSHLSFQHGVKQFDDENQTGAEDQQRESQQDQTNGKVRKIHVHKQVVTW